MRNHILEISKSIRERELALFCGAGISKNSGLPLANELEQHILEKLPVDKEGRNEIMTSNLPFEAFIEEISETVDISKILDMFEDGTPNTNHILIARLAQNGYLNTILTTNFDLLIEKAFEEDGLKRDKDFKVYYDERQFSEMNFRNIDDEGIRIFKIHGSVEEKESIRTTLKAVASKTLSDKRMCLIRYLFSTGRHKRVLVLGYSCSDEFDITPQIQNVQENYKEIIFVDHSKVEEEIADIKAKVDKNPFKRFPGKRLKCNADHFIKGLWDSLKEIVGEHTLIKSKTEWKSHINQWAKGLEESRGYLEYSIAGSVFFMISNFKRAIEYYEKSLKVAKEIGDKEKESRCYTNLGIAHRNLGDSKRAIEYHEKSLGIEKVIGNKAGESRCYTNLGTAYYGSGDFKQAIEYYEKSLEIKKQIGDKAGESRCYTGLGIAYRNLRDFKRAIENYEKSLGIAEGVGDKAEESRCYTGLGIAHRELGDSKRAIEYHEKSLGIEKVIRNKSGESICYTNVGAAYYSSGDFKRAIEYFLKSGKIFDEIGQIHYLKTIYKNLSLAYKAIGDYENAEKYKKLANLSLRDLPEREDFQPSFG